MISALQFGHCSIDKVFNPLPNNKILDLSKFKEHADNKINVTQKLKSVMGRVENILGKGENAVTSIFFFSQNVCKRLLFSLKVVLGWLENMRK